MAPELAIARLEYYRSKGRSLPKGLGNAYKSSDRTGRILRASDIWAVGVIAYILVTGHRPFRGHNNIAIFASIVKDKLLFPRNDGRYHNELILNPQFIDFTQKLMAKNPNQRYIYLSIYLLHVETETGVVRLLCTCALSVVLLLFVLWSFTFYFVLFFIFLFIFASLLFLVFF